MFLGISLLSALSKPELGLAGAVLIACGLLWFRLGNWPWDHDEVPSLIELGLLEAPEYQRESGQFERLPRLVPVWYSLQRQVLRVLPQDEFGTRVLSVLCGMSAVCLAAFVAARWRGPLFAAALTLLIGGSQCFVWLVQQNRFYATSLLSLLLTILAIWRPSVRSGFWLLAAAGLGAVAVLSHNLILVVLMIGCVAAWLAYLLGTVPRHVVLRSTTAAMVAAALYVAYLRPIMQGWVSGDTGGTNILISFAAQAGMPTLAFAAFGLVAAVRAWRTSPDLVWWSLVLMGCSLFLGLVPWLLSAWNPRYAILFLPPFWVLAAFGVERIAVNLPGPTMRLALLAVVALLLTPKLLSHFRDGSRHDFRAGAATVLQHDRAGEPVYCNWPETLEYYLSGSRVQGVRTWWAGSPLPEEPCLIVYASNAFEPPPASTQRSIELLAEISQRRFDEQSHVVRVFRVDGLPRAEIASAR